MHDELAIYEESPWFIKAVILVGCSVGTAILIVELTLQDIWQEACDLFAASRHKKRLV
ncbi:MAG: hypothetical protein V4465_02475 [Patescibacteria group bacterium]